MKKIFTLIAALVATLSINAATIGPEDNTAGWWTAFSDAYNVKEGEVAKISFVNHNAGVILGDDGKPINHFTWLTVLTQAGTGNPITVSPWDNTKEYGAIRADNYGWGTYFDRWQEDVALWAADYTCNYIWENPFFPEFANGAKFDITIKINDEGKFELNSVATKDGKTYDMKVVSRNAAPAKGFSFFFSVEKAHLTDFTVSIEKQAVASNHTYDFTAWSAATAANLKADAAADIDAGWTDVEKADHSSDPMTDKCYWAVAEVNAEGQLSANGVIIEELKGLKFDATYAAKRALAIAVNYPETSLGTYAGPQYLWLGSKNSRCFTIPNVAAGSTITVCAESHKPSDARGIQLKQGDTQIGESFTPTTQATYTWTVETAGDVDVYNTNGCHIYYIDVNGGGTGVSNVKAAPVKAQPKKVLTKNGIIIGGKYTIGGALAK
jgi:hypothetical protein